jgi:hypothetical protein
VHLRVNDFGRTLWHQAAKEIHRFRIGSNQHMVLGKNWNTEASRKEREQGKVAF